MLHVQQYLTSPTNYFNLQSGARLPGRNDNFNVRQIASTVHRQLELVEFAEFVGGVDNIWFLLNSKLTMFSVCMLRGPFEFMKRGFCTISSL
uniref:ORF72 n=1 Tax=Cydia pomonella granulosis virus TaxID=28289 RepID=A0A097P0R0_GVCP|nr:ORF72 [Cydia pomonella granulovirus]QGY99939.1 ORF72 [Cydia pomonella granulovirus]